MKRIDWYFDFISPFSYLQFELLARFQDKAEVHLRPVLFAGLLKHWGNVGPAELEPKRIWTFEHCAWLAHKYGIPLRLPASHPFNPLPLLRLAVAWGGIPGSSGEISHQVAKRIFHFVWQDGHLPTEPAWAGLLSEAGLTEDDLRQESVKLELAANGKAAIAEGIFGVPTVLIDGRTFWGLDATDMVEAYLLGSPFFESTEFKAAHTLAPGLQRKVAPPDGPS